MTEIDIYSPALKNAHQKIGELVYLNNTIDNTIDRVICYLIGLDTDHIIISLLRHCSISKRLDFLIFLLKEHEKSDTNSLAELGKNMRSVKAMRDYVSHCSINETDGQVFFEKSNIMDFEKAESFIEKRIERIAGEVIKKKGSDFENREEFTVALAKALLKEAPKKTMNDLDEAVRLARDANMFLISFHKKVLSASLSQ